MKRRAALATSLLLTTVAAFVIVVYGREAGLFGGGDEAASAQAPVVVLPTMVPTAAPTPVVIERIVYQDEYVAGGPSAPASSSGSTSADNSASAQGQGPQPSPVAPTSGGGEDHGDGEQQVGELPVTGTEFSGTVLAVSGSSFTIAVGSQQILVRLSQSTDVHDGALVAGVIAKVHTINQGDGTLLATEIEVVGGEHGDD